VTPPLPQDFLRPIAHRGLHDRAAGQVENSRAAVAAAAEAGYGVELDLQLSADAEAMAFHDDALDRLTSERGPLRARSAAELGRIALSGGGETIPTLGEILSLVAGRAPLLIELKDQSGALGPQGAAPLAARASALLAGYGGPAAVMSFNPHLVAEMARLAPETPRGLVAAGPACSTYAACAPERRAALAALADWEAAGASFVSYGWRDLPAPAVSARRAAGAAVLCWTVRSPEQEAAARAHADAVTFEGYRPPVDPGAGDAI
jgi:glycerophosphoryl diester phosphodiesterase